MPATSLDQLSINTIRMLSVDAIQKANSGHPGLPMGAAVMAYTLWTRHLKHNPSNPHWADRDRFVLSAGHGSMLLYSLLHLTGYDLPLDQIRQFRQWDSMTPGHPESHMTPGVEVTTGPLGQGFANAVGMAIAERFLAERFNTDQHRIVDHYIYTIVGDGCLEEGVSAEAASYAGTQGLSKLIALYDDNEITIEGDTDVTFREDVGARFRAYGWNVLGPVDGNDVDAVDNAIKAAKAQSEKPTLIICTTVIGYGSPNKAGTHGVHGSPLGPDEVKLTKQNLGWPLEPEFHIPAEALANFRQAVEKGTAAEKMWAEAVAAYRAVAPAKVAEFERMMAGTLPAGWDSGVPVFKPEDPAVATRVAGGKVLNGLFKYLPDLVGGSADLAPSTNTWLESSGRFGWDKGGHNLQYGVREHAMGALALGMAHHGGVIPYTATFLTFADYMRTPIRLAALSHQRVVFVFTHDSIGLGEDGPTHQPVEHLATLRAIPHVHVIRPADANETAEAWRQALLYTDGPTVIVLSRQNLPTIDSSTMAPASNLAKGAYVLQDSVDGKPDVILLATGSEVELAVKSAAKLAEGGVKARIVSMPCWELFDAQDAAYRASVLLPGVPKVSIEAGISQGWHKYVGDNGAVIALDRFGASAPAKIAFEKLGFSVDNVVATARRVSGK
ncbi:MAG: transketolase [Anaerolineae bacterium]|nr:transketolase [Anaerolineae bacterium]